MIITPAGAFTYYSYRDPNNLETFTVYRNSTDWVLGGGFSQQDVEEAVLRVFQVKTTDRMAGREWCKLTVTNVDSGSLTVIVPGSGLPRGSRPPRHEGVPVRDHRLPAGTAQGRPQGGHSAGGTGFPTGWRLDFLENVYCISEPSPVQDLVTVCEKYLVEPALCGKALIGGANKNLDEMGWKVHQQ